MNEAELQRAFETFSKSSYRKLPGVAQRLPAHRGTSTGAASTGIYLKNTKKPQMNQQTNQLANNGKKSTRAVTVFLQVFGYQLET